MPDGLTRLAAELNARQVRALYVGMGAWPELRQEVLAMLRSRANPRHAASVWSLWIRYPGVAEIVELARFFVGVHGLERAVGSSYAGVAHEWVRALDPPRRIREWLAETGLRREELDPGEDGTFADTPMARAVFEEILVRGTAAQLRSEATADLLDGFEQLSPPRRQEMGANYLTRLRAGDWDHRVCERLRKAYGLPGAEGSTGPFWRRVPDEAQAAFRRLYFQKRLRRAFGAGTDRHRYWEHWIDAMRDFREGHAGTVKYAILRFQGFGVVEFFEVGNAAYFYNDRDLERILNRRIQHQSDLKDQTAGERLIHGQFWQAHANSMMARWTRRR